MLEIISFVRTDKLDFNPLNYYMVKEWRMVELDVPEFIRFRKVVGKIHNERDRNLIKLLYLCAARQNEVCNKLTRDDKTKPYGAFLTWEIKKFKAPRDTLVIKVACLKRKVKDPSSPKFRYVGLPLDPLYEPWSGDLIKYMTQQAEEKEMAPTLQVNLTRQRVYQIVRDTLYSRFGMKPNREEHFLNILRHFRSTHLVSVYNFDILDLVAYCGWSVRAAAGAMGMVSGQSQSYLHLKWRKYYLKLLVPLEKLLA